MVSAPEQLRPTEEPKLDRRVEDAHEILRTPEDEERLGKILEKRQTVPVTQQVTDDQGNKVLESRIPTLDELSLPQDQVKPLRWYHFHTHIGSAIKWVVDSILRREKKKNAPHSVDVA